MCCTPMLHGKHFFFLILASVGTRFVIFSTPPQRECDFFHFFNTSAARMPKIKKSGPRSHRLNASVRKTQIWKSHKIAKTLANRFKIVCNPQGIWAISVSAQVRALHNFHEIVSFEPQNIRKFTDSHFAFLLKTLHGHHRPYVGKINHQISYQRASNTN